MTAWASTASGMVTVGEYGTTLLAKYPKPAGTMPGILYCHGNTGRSFEATNPEYVGVLGGLADLGYPILSGDWGGATACGNDTALARVTAGKAYLQGTMGAKAGKIILIGTSMGGLTAMAWAAANPALVSCLVGMLPVCDLTDVHTNNRSGLAAVVNAAYGGTYSEATYGATHNPLTMAVAGKLSALKMRLFYGSTDSIALPAKATALATAAGANTVLSSVPGDHATTTLALIDAATVLAFIQANA